MLAAISILLRPLNRLEPKILAPVVTVLTLTVVVTLDGISLIMLMTD